jgi:hypothetical protein
MAKHTVSLQSLGLALNTQGQIEITGLALDNRQINPGIYLPHFRAVPCMGPDLHSLRLKQARLRS